MANAENKPEFKSIFDDSFFHAARYEDESREDYKKRQKANKQFEKMYKRFGRERFIQFMDFMKKMGEQEIPQQDAE
jgi:hypothetical protein